MTEVGVLEVVVVLQAVAEQTVTTDVGEPDQAEATTRGSVCHQPELAVPRFPPRAARC
jgi:hypothetical protein